jgi:dihydrofolate synthase/folylpolyglutamate synthase
MASVITPVSHDHAEFLGTDLAGIAGEKAGIIKRDTPVISSWQQSVVLDVIEKQAQRLHAPLSIGGQDFNCYEQHGRFVYEDERGLLDLPKPRLPGQHQFENAATAIAALRIVAPDLPASAYEAGIPQTDWPARLQKLTHGQLAAIIPQGAELWLDGGHNEAGGRVLAEAMADFEDAAPRPLILICGTLSTKDTAGFLVRFHGLAQEVIAVAVPGEHAARSAQEVAQIARSVDINASEAESVQTALKSIAARKWAVAPRILIAGSLYLAGDVLRANGTPPV